MTHCPIAKCTYAVIEKAMFTETNDPNPGGLKLAPRMRICAIEVGSAPKITLQNQNGRQE